jgi:hypothetical protein
MVYWNGERDKLSHPARFLASLDSETVLGTLLGFLSVGEANSLVQQHLLIFHLFYSFSN